MLVTLLMDLGLKLGEVLDADAQDFATPPPTLITTRRDRPQPIALSRRTAAAIRSYLSGRESGPLLLGASPTRTPGRLSRAGANHVLNRVTHRAGITKPVSANTLRRYYATNAYANGMHIDDIRAHLGHDDRRTTRRLLPLNHTDSQLR